MIKYTLVVFRKLANGASSEFMTYEFNNKELLQNATLDIIRQGCWKTIPQDPNKTKTRIISEKIFLPPYQVAELKVIEQEM